MASDSARTTDCPRCGGGVPNDERRGEYPGALSRYDNKTYVCSACGEREALYQWAHNGALPPLDVDLRQESG